MATEETFEDILRTNGPELLLLIDTDSGLEGELMNLLTPIQRRRIWEIRDNTIKRNELLLGIISKGGFEKFQAFCEALERSDQKSIVTRHLSKKKEKWSSSDDPDDPRASIPLRKSYSDCLNQNWNNLLVNVSNLKEIEVGLSFRKSLAKFQQTRLQEFTKDSEKVEFLLSILEKGSQKLFDDFCEILMDTKQVHLVTALTPSEEQRSLDDVKTLFHEVKLGLPSSAHRERILSEIESGNAYAVSNGYVKGRVLVFSNRYFVNARQNRYGTEYDEANLKDFFKTKLKFETDVYRDLTAVQMREKLEAETKKPLNDFDVFILFFLSHGIEGEIYGIDGRTFLTNDIADMIDGKRCPQLVEKPKLLFIQACRRVRVVRRQEASVQTDGGALVQEIDNWTLDDMDDEVKLNFEKLNKEDVDDDSPVPHHPQADMAVFFATVKGDPSYRRETEGSFFVRYLLDVFTKKAHTEDVLSMVTEAMCLVHKLHWPQAKQRQLGEQKNRLLRKVYLVI